MAAGVKDKALASVLEKFDNLVEESAELMTDEEFRAAEARANRVFEKVKVRVSQRFGDTLNFTSPAE